MVWTDLRFNNFYQKKMQERVCVYIYIYNGGYTCSTRQHVRLVSDYSRFHEAVPLYFFFFNLLFIYLFMYACLQFFSLFGR